MRDLIGIVGAVGAIVAFYTIAIAAVTAVVGLAQGASVESPVRFRPGSIVSWPSQGRPGDYAARSEALRRFDGRALTSVRRSMREILFSVTLSITRATKGRASTSSKKAA